MFTGIIDHCGTIIEMRSQKDSQRLWIQHHFTDLVLGESIAVDGICLTVTEFDNTTFCCDVSPETHNVTTARHFNVGATVNLERALQLSSRLGGHIVMGHVEQLCQVKQIKPHDQYVEIRFTGLNEDTNKFVITKGSIAINGVSLTINEVKQNAFTVMLIPHTLERTNLFQLQEGDAVNIEFDMMVRAVIQQVEKWKNEVTI